MFFLFSCGKEEKWDRWRMNLFKWESSELIKTKLWQWFDERSDKNMFDLLSFYQSCQLLENTLRCILYFLSGWTLSSRNLSRIWYNKGREKKVVFFLQADEPRTSNTPASVGSPPSSTQLWQCFRENLCCKKCVFISPVASSSCCSASFIQLKTPHI